MSSLKDVHIFANSITVLSSSPMSDLQYDAMQSSADEDVLLGSFVGIVVEARLSSEFRSSSNTIMQPALTPHKLIWNRAGVHEQCINVSVA